jgi:hypothetical protein
VSASTSCFMASSGSSCEGTETRVGKFSMSEVSNWNSANASIGALVCCAVLSVLKGGNARK